MSRNLFERCQALGDEPVYCEAEPSEVLYKGSDDEDYGSSWERRWAYERTAANFLNGGTKSLMSARLQGPFNKASGWTNPWRSKSVRITKPISPVKLSKSTAQSAVNTGPQKTSKQSNPPEPAVCHLPSPISLDNKFPEHLYLDEEDIARVEEWRTSIDHTKSQPDAFWAPSNHQTNHHTESRKRQAQNTNWLKRTQKRRRTDGGEVQNMEQSSLLVHNDFRASSISGEDVNSGDDGMEEDELQADTQVKPWASADVATPSRRSPTRRGLQRSPRNPTSNEDSDDELSRPSETAQRSRVWRTASARSQVSRPGRQPSPRSSPSKRYGRGKTAPATEIAIKSTQAGDNEDLAEWQTQQDNSFIYRVRRKPTAPRPQTTKPEPSQRSSSSLSSAPDEISDFTSLGSRKNDPSPEEIVLCSSRPQNSQNFAMEAVRNSLRATPESSVICTSQPGLDSSTLVEKDQESTSVAAEKELMSLDKVEGEAMLPAKAPVSEDQPSRLNRARSTIESSDVMQLEPPSEAKPDTAPKTVEVKASDEKTSQERDENEPADTPTTPAEKSTDSLASPQLPKDDTECVDESGRDETYSDSVAVSPGRDSILSNIVQCRVEEQIFLESTHMEEASGAHMPENAGTTSKASVGSESTVPRAADAGESTNLAEHSTPVSKKHTALAESQQTPWQAGFQGNHLVAGVQPHESQATQNTSSVAFSQGNGSIPPISQQTPWYRESSVPRLSEQSSPLTARVANPVLSHSASQSPWTRSFEQMRAAAHTALFAAGFHLSFSREQSLPVPEEMPEETGSIVSAETPSLHTAPSTPGNDAPDAVFADASSSPPDTQLSPSPQSDPLDDGFTLKPFSAFRSPSPETTVSRPRKARMSRGRLSGTRSILIATSHPWNSVPRTKKRVSWAMVDDTPEDEDYDRLGRSSLSTPSRTRAASPPPEQALADLPTGEKDAFQKHFSAVKMKVKGHSHRILPSASQQVLRSPAPTAMADAFLTADEMIKPASSSKSDVDGSIARVAAPAEEMQDFVVTQNEEFDDVDEVLRNLGDFIDVMDVEMDIQLAKDDSNGFVGEKPSKARVSLASQLDVNVWEQY